MLQTDVFLELHVPDFDIAEEFYGYLGFERVWRKNGPKGYMVLRKAESVISFYGGTPDVGMQNYFKNFPGTTKRGYAVEVVLLSEDIDGYYKTIYHNIKRYIVEPLTLKPWGRKDFRLEDPFGFYIRIGEKYDWINKYSGLVE